MCIFDISRFFKARKHDVVVLAIEIGQSSYILIANIRVYVAFRYEIPERDVTTRTWNNMLPNVSLRRTRQWLIYSINNDYTMIITDR